MLRESTSEYFEALFKEVVVAEDGKEALEYYKNSLTEGYGSFDIVISDIQMPNMSGIELSRELVKLNKNQKIIIVSAYNETEYFIELIKIGISGFMQKPLSSTQVLDILYEVCIELDRDAELNRFIRLGDEYTWDKNLECLILNSNEVKLTSNETELLNLFISNIGQKFTDFDIFTHLNNDDIEKEFSSNSVKSLLKRLRKKIPEKLIQTHKNLGYSLHLL